MTPWRVLLCALLAGGGLTVVSPSALAASSPLTWSAPVRVDDSANSLISVSCPTGDLCVAVDGAGNVVTSTNPTGGAGAWALTSTPVRWKYYGLYGVSCPSSSLCVAYDTVGDLVTSSNPTGGAAAWTLTSLSGPLSSNVNGLNGVSCPSNGFCALLAGSEVVTSSNPTGGAAAWTPYPVGASGLTALSCPSSGLCVAVDNAGNVVTSSNPTGGVAAWTVTNVDGTNSFSGVSCPASGLCVAVDTKGNVVTSTNPAGGPSAWTVTQADDFGVVTSVGCSSSGLCVLGDSAGGNVSISSSPTGGAAAWTQTHIDGSNYVYGVACVGSSLCVVGDTAGNVLTGSLTTTTAVASSQTPSTVGGSVTYTATVAPTPDGGTVAFTDNGSTLTGCGAIAVNTSTGTATCTTSYNTVGSHSIVAAYSGDTNYAASSGSLVEQVNPPPSVYTAVTPVRLLDTRNTGTTLGSGGSLNLAIGGVSVPADATAVVLNVTATDTTAASFFTVYPTGGAFPTVSNLNWLAGQTVPNLVTVSLGTGGAITIFNDAGRADAVVDLEGYFAPSTGGTAGEFVPLSPARIADTRTGSGQPNAGSHLGPGTTVNVQVTGAGLVPPTGAATAVLNVTVTRWHSDQEGWSAMDPTDDRSESS